VIDKKARGKGRQASDANFSFSPFQSDRISRQRRNAETETMMIGVRRDQPFSYSAFWAIRQGVDANLGGCALSI
jgi:hypothetical protein